MTRTPIHPSDPRSATAHKGCSTLLLVLLVIVIVAVGFEALYRVFG